MFLFMLLPSVSLAQNTRRVTGTVVDETGEALIGVTVTEPGGANGAITDLDGNFSLDLSTGTNSIQVSYVGYKTKTVTIPSSGKVTIQMAVPLCGGAAFLYSAEDFGFLIMSIVKRSDGSQRSSMSNFHSYP